MNALTFALNEIPWQFFCSPTLDEKPGIFQPRKLDAKLEGRMYKTLFAWLREIAGWHRVHFKRLLWCSRLEIGETTGRPHFHCLLAGLPQFAVHSRTQFSISRAWSRYFIGGHADVRLWDGRGAVPYILKGEDWSSAAANRYELGKYALGTCQVTLSHSVLAWFDAAERKQERIKRRERPRLYSEEKRIRALRL